MYKKISHVGVAVRSIEKALEAYASAMGIPVERIEDVLDQRTRVAVLPIGESRVELLEAMAEDSPVGKFIAKRGEGLHHICFQVEDIEQEIEKLRAAGMRLIDEVPRIGAGGCRVAFIHPSSTAGVLIELSQPCSDDALPGAE